MTSTQPRPTVLRPTLVDNATGAQVQLVSVHPGGVTVRNVSDGSAYDVGLDRIRVCIPRLGGPPQLLAVRARGRED